jgi:monoamine oxidase
MPDDHASVDVAIVGGGLAGLTAARALEDDGHNVMVCEAREEVGGRTRSRVIDGCVIELGGTFLSLSQWRLTRLARALGLTIEPTGLWTGAPIRWRRNGYAKAVRSPSSDLVRLPSSSSRPGRRVTMRGVSTPTRHGFRGRRST